MWCPATVVPSLHLSWVPRVVPQMIAAAFPVPALGDEGAAALPVLPVVGGAGAAGGADLGSTWDGILPPGNVGQMLKALGQLAVGRTVERFWADEGAPRPAGRSQEPIWQLCRHLQHLDASLLPLAWHVRLCRWQSAPTAATLGCRPHGPLPLLFPFLAGGWWAALISDYNAESGEHQLTYNAGQEDESYEWADLGQLGNEELRWGIGIGKGTMP